MRSHNFKALPVVYKNHFNLEPEDEFIKPETL
jgi:hypothetical protein